MGSPSIARSRASAWLAADWVNPTFAAARVTCRSTRSASSTTRRLRSMPTRLTSCSPCISRMQSINWIHLGGKPRVVRMKAIAGVSGNTGSVVADTLLAQGHPVRVIVRDPAKGEPWRARGAEVAIADLDDPAALTRALRGTDGAYLLTPPRYGATDPIAENRAVVASLARAVRDAGVPHVVFLSSKQ